MRMRKREITPLEFNSPKEMAEMVRAGVKVLEAEEPPDLDAMCRRIWDRCPTDPKRFILVLSDRGDSIGLEIFMSGTNALDIEMS